MATVNASEKTQGSNATAEPSTLQIGDTLTVMSGCLDGAWVVEDDAGIVYLATAVE